MSITQKPAVTLANLSFTWSDGDLVFRDLSATFATGRTGLIGSNGTGKTTLLRVIAGDLTATSGSVIVTGQGWLPAATPHLEHRCDSRRAARDRRPAGRVARDRVR